MSASLEPSDDPEIRVRALLDAWVKRDPRHPVPDFARKISIVSIRDRTAYAGFLRCLFDVRTTPVSVLLPYRESVPPKIADKNDPRGLASGLSRQFLDQETTVVAAEAGEPIDCNRCTGESQAQACARCHGAKTAPCEACSRRGRKSCSSCGGQGSIACAQCAGTGKVLQSLAADGMRNEEACPQCTGNKAFPCPDCADATAPDCAVCANKRVVACPECGGRGAPQCAQCGGSRRVVNGFSVAIAHKLAYYRSLARDPSIPEAVFPEDPASGKLGETVLECESEDAASLAGKKPAGAAGDAFAKVLAQVPADGLGANSKLVLQSLSVERIPIYEIACAFEGKEYNAWATSFENRVAFSSDPFADLASRWSAEAESLLEKNEFALFEESAAKAAALAPQNPAVAALRGKAGDRQRRAAIAFGAKVAGGAAVAIPALLALAYSSPNRFAPLAALGLAVLGLSLAAVFRLGSALASRPLLPPRRRNAWASGAAAAGTALAIAAFLVIGPIRRIDAAEFAGKISRYAALPFAQWGAGDDAALAATIKDYTARGVDTVAGQDLLDKHASFLAVARTLALQEAQARRLAALAARLKAEKAKKAAALEKALAAKRLAAKKAAALKAKKKRRKKSRQARDRAFGPILLSYHIAVNFQFKPHPILAHWVPGFFLSATVLLRHYNWSYHALMEYMPPSQTKSFIVGLAVAVTAWIAGQGLDAARDIAEHVLDLACPIDWEFFFWADPPAIDKFEEHYFSYYVFCFNTAIALAGMLVLWLFRGAFTVKEIEGITFLLLFFAADTYLLRMEIHRVLGEWSQSRGAVGPTNR